MEAVARYGEIARNLYGIDDLTRYCPTEAQTVTALVEVAKCYADVKEIGASNKGWMVTRMTRRLGLRGALPWCAIWVDQVYWDVSSMFGMPDLLPYNTAGTQQLYARAERDGCATIAIELVGVGALVVYADGDSGQGHTELLIGRSDTAYDSMGGNTTDDDEINREGNQVGVHRGVKWHRYGPIGVPRSKRWTRGFIPAELLYRRHWAAEIARRRALA